ncbi:MAG: septum formation initiator family protein [Verrucomicrobiota bacterium]
MRIEQDEFRWDQSAHEPPPRQRTGLVGHAIRFVVLLIALTLLVALWALFQPQLDRQAALQKELAERERQLAQVERERDLVERQLALVRHDREYLEIIARDRLHLRRPGETILRILRPSDED